MLGKASTNAPQKDYGLTAREKDILQLLVQGHSTKEAAAQLQISYHTADGYIRDIYEKLQVNTRSGVVAKALKEGLV
jgi:DNA-binding CsgD family transcriptional regulator